VVRSQDARAARAGQTLLANAGVEAAALAGAYRPAPDGEDIAIFPALSGDLAGAAGLARQTLEAEQPPLAALLGLASAMPPPRGLDHASQFTGAISLDAPPKLLAAQVEACIRVAAAQDEKARRAATAAALALTAPKPLAIGKLKALYVGAPSAMFLSLEHALAEQGGLVAAAFSSFTGFDHLHDDVFDAVVLNGAQNASTALSLCAALRRNATLFHLPTMVVISPGDRITADAAIERGASAVAEANAPCGQSLGWLFEAVRRDRQRRLAEHDGRGLRDLMGEARTGLFRRDTFDAHLARLARDHHASGRPLALAALRVMPAHGARQPSEQVWRKGFGEIASLAGRLIREADSGAAVGADLIALALPASDLIAAKRTAERIAAVAECTAFASGEGDAGPLVFEQSVAELQPGESGAGLLARALRAIEVESIPA
jgi:two-component system cell cycle response regulator PopA